MPKYDRQWRDRFALKQQQIEQLYIENQSLRWHQRFRLAASALYRTMASSDIMTMSAALAYTVALSLIPLVTTTIAFFTAFPGLQSERDRLMGLLYNQLLPNAVQSAQEYISQFADRAAAAGAVSSLIFFVTVLMLLRSLEGAFNGIWRVKIARTWDERLRTLAVFFISGAIAATMFVIVQKETSALVEYITKLEFLGIGRRFARISVTFTNLAVAWGLFSIAYHVLPNTKVKWKHSLIAGVLAGTIWHVLKSGFTWYIEEVASYKNIYGALGAVPILFFWIYLSFLVLLGGGYLSYVLQELKTVLLAERTREPEFPNGFYSVVVTAALAKAFQNQEAPLSRKEISNRIQIPAYFVSNALEPLCRSGIIIQVRQKKGDRYIVGRPVESIRLGDVVSAATGNPLQVPQTFADTPLNKRVELVFQEIRGISENALNRIRFTDVI